MIKKVTVIDLFAGPGGLGEGFSNCCKQSPFNIAMSVEKEPNAHKTLTLRSYFRKLKNKQKYVDYVTSRNGKAKSAALDVIMQSKEWEEACYETLKRPHALGNSNIFEKWKSGEVPNEADFLERTVEQQEIDDRIEQIIRETGRDRSDSLSDCKPVIVIGGPPCQAYSTIGRGVRAGNPDHNQDHDQRFFLYKEYADTIAHARPDIFVMENVSGIGSAKLANGELIFPKIIRRLEYLKDDPSDTDEKVYHIYSLVKKKSDFLGTDETPSEKDYLVRAVDFGVPQDRRRVILLGVRAEHDPENALELVMSNEIVAAPSVAETIASLPKIRSSFSPRKASSFKLDNLDDSDDSWARFHRSNLIELRTYVAGTEALARGVDAVIRWEKESARYKATKRLKAERGSVRLPASELALIEEKRGEYRELLATIYPRITERIDSLLSQEPDKLSVGDNGYVQSNSKQAIQAQDGCRYADLEKWLYSADLKGALNHKAKQHMPDDLKRYMFSALWTDATKDDCMLSGEVSASPKTKFFPIDLAADHESWYSNNFQDRFRTYASSHRAKTITAHMHKDGHANIHYDPAQCRSLTVREAARIQTFPDDYFFEGGQSAQYLQVGNAVPPFLAKQIALHVLEVMKKLGIY